MKFYKAIKYTLLFLFVITIICCKQEIITNINILNSTVNINNPTITWDAESNNNVKYRVQISSTKEFKQILDDARELNEKEYKIPIEKFKNGEYYCRICEEGENIEKARAFVLKIDLQTEHKVTQNNDELLKDGLIVYYPFNGNANDESGNGNDGKVYGATLAADRFGNHEKAYSFNGETTWIKAENSNSLNISGNASLSLCAWVNTSSIKKQGVVSKWLDGSYELGQYLMQITVDGFPEFHVDPHPKGGMLISKSKLTANSWHFIVCVFDNAKGIIKIFIDNQQIEEANFTRFPIPPTTRYLEIGSSSNRYYFAGFLDDIRIFNLALTDNQIQSLYHEGGWK